MVRFYSRWTGCLLACAVAFGAGMAAADTPDSHDTRDARDAGETAPVTLVSDVHEFVIQHDGSLDEHDDSTLRANDANGIDTVAQRYVWFDKHLEKVELLAAETIDRDGVAHPVLSLIHI